MTPASLRTSLAGLLKNQLGTYSEGNLSRGPALRVGEPPSAWRADGVEVRIEPAGEFSNRVLHRHTLVHQDIPVRVIAHGVTGDKAATVVARISSAFVTSDPTLIPANESFEILAQYVLRVRSK